MFGFIKFNVVRFITVYNFYRKEAPLEATLKNCISFFAVAALIGMVEFDEHSAESKELFETLEN